MMITKENALHCAKVFEDYFGNFNRVDEYMRDQKLNSLGGLSTNPLFPIEDDLFSILQCIQKIWILKYWKYHRRSGKIY